MWNKESLNEHIMKKKRKESQYKMQKMFLLNNEPITLHDKLRKKKNTMNTYEMLQGVVVLNGVNILVIRKIG